MATSNNRGEVSCFSGESVIVKSMQRRASLVSPAGMESDEGSILVQLQVVLKRSITISLSLEFVMGITQLNWFCSQTDPKSRYFSATSIPWVTGGAVTFVHFNNRVTTIHVVTAATTAIVPQNPKGVRFHFWEGIFIPCDIATTSL
jgi:hypothetical protein